MSVIINSAGSKSGVIGTTELDYEDGDWTPEDTDGNGSSQFGRYTKIGHLVTCYFSFTTGGSYVTGGNIFYITNFPFTVGLTDADRGVISIGYTSSPDYPKTGNIANADTKGYLMHATEDIATNDEIGESRVLTGSISYRVD